MDKHVSILLMFLLLLSCEEKKLEIDQLISKVSYSSDTIIANGYDKVEIEIFLNKKAATKNWEIELVTTNGVFEESAENKVTVKTEVFPDGNQKAKAVLVSTTKYSNPVVSIELENYKRIDTLNSIISKPHSISLSSNSFTVIEDYGSEVLITGNVFNSNGAKSSDGFGVVITDTLENGDQINGLIRDGQLKTKNGKISFIYTPGLVDAYQNILLEASIPGYVDVAEEIKIYIKPKEE
ncbi:MAG: hypothetical protein N4A71_06720 [Carboxylicivirga sp.]|jgi:hypothetical protein|nr:hypothetical protein [Carboxylicivirga sp.]